MDEKQYLSVTALTKYIKYKFDNDVHLKNVLLKGEISNFKHHSRGHFYFTLKDDKAQISAIMFASSSKNVLFKPESGMSVLVEGYLTVYESTGQYQIYVNKMDEDGVGSLHVAYEQLKKKLSDEGLFDVVHKKPIPKFPSTIAVLTSPTGAAVRDIINIVNRRYPLAKIVVYPTLVQGEFAKDAIVKNLKQVNERGDADVIILGRGGGSIEDLWPFNEEIVAYEIFKSNIPIISSVGHETDFTISDFVADLRAPTPSGGAELAVPDQNELLNYIAQLEAASKTSLVRLLKSKKERLERLKMSYVFKDPMRLTESKSRRYDHLREKLELLSPVNRIIQSYDKVNHLTMKVQNYYDRYLTKQQNDYVILLNKLELLNPLSIMKKGYSVTKKDGKILKSVSEIKKQDQLDILFNDGSVIATVNEVRKDN
jgi:exodeoxyribonuclease VII large subunit